MVLLFAMPTMTNRRTNTVFTIVSLLLVGLVAFLCFNRGIKQDDGWYASYVMKWMQKIGNTTIKAYWDYTDTNDYDAGCSFVYTVLEGLYFTIAGISIVSMKLLNTIEALLLLYVIYRYFSKENKILGLIAICCFAGWTMFYNHYFNRPELPASVIAVWILNLLIQHKDNSRKLFLAFMLTGVLLDLHPLSLFLVAGVAAVTFFQTKHKLQCIAGGLCGITLYFAGNYLVNRNYGLFTTAITGIQISPGDHYIPILNTGWQDMWNITKERFRFMASGGSIVGVIKQTTFLFTFVIALYLFFRRKMVTTTLCRYGLITYATFLALSTLLSEATSNGFRMYHGIAFGLAYFALLYDIYQSVKVKYIVLAGIIPFMIFVKESIPKVRVYYQYHLVNGYYHDFEVFNRQIPDHSHVLMRPTHALFNYRLNNRYDFTYGLLRYMQKNNLSFKDAIVQKHYDYITTDELFKMEFFTDHYSPYRQSPAPYYVPLRNTGIRSTAFDSLVQSGFLSRVAALHDDFAGNTILYQVKY